MKIGCSDANQLSLDLDESMAIAMQQQSSSSLLSSSPPSGRTSPPMPLTPIVLTNQEPLELQIDYWPIASRIGGNDKERSQSKGTDQSKNSIKSTFRNLQVSEVILFFYVLKNLFVNVCNIYWHMISHVCNIFARIWNIFECICIRFTSICICLQYICKYLLCLEIIT